MGSQWVTRRCCPAFRNETAHTNYETSMTNYTLQNQTSNPAISEGLNNTASEDTSFEGLPVNDVNSNRPASTSNNIHFVASSSSSDSPGSSNAVIGNQPNISIRIPGTTVCEPSEIVLSKPNNIVGALQWSCESPFINCAISASSSHSTTTNQYPFIHRLYQENPRKTSSKPHWRNFCHSLESYEKAAGKEYQILQRHFFHTHRYPDFHLIVNFHSPMVIKDFSGIRNMAFGYLAKQSVKAFYVHEPSRESWIHIHALVIFDNKEYLRDVVKAAFTKAGLVYGRDFHVKVLSVSATGADFQYLCSYILKFNGGRTYKFHKPLLFLKGLKIRKVGTIGKWFTLSKKVLWDEYIEEIRRKYGNSLPNNIPDILPEFIDFDGHQSLTH